MKNLNPASPENFYEEDGIYESWLSGEDLNEEIIDEEITPTENVEEMNEEEIEKIIQASAPVKIEVKPVIKLKEEETDPYANILKDVQ